ncbi:MAG: carbohydrate-binding protein, partial [Vibrio litoralis]
MAINRNSLGKNAFRLSALTASCLMAFNSYAAVDCGSLDSWDAGTVYNGGDQVQQDNNAYSAKYWTQGNSPKEAGEWGAWALVDACSTDVVTN